MTGNELYPDPTEDRVRRTFAVRGEDMAPGDGAAGEQGLQMVLGRADGGALGGRRPPRRGLLAAAVVVVVGAALAAVAVVVAGGGADETGDLATDGRGGSDAPAVDVAIASRELVRALQDERNLASVDLIGQSDLVALAVDDPEAARRNTDAAIAALRPLVDSGSASAAYQAAMDRFAGLAALRDDIDDYDGPRNMQALDTANDVFARYAQQISGLVDAQGEVARMIDDPDLRTGIEVHQLGLRQQELTTQLVRTALLVTIEPGSSTVTELSRLYDLAQQGQDALREEATGTSYEDTTIAVLDEIEASGLLDLAAAGLQGPTDIAGILDAVELPADQGWPAFLDRVEAILTAES